VPNGASSERETGSELTALPGIGKYTARAVLCFSYGRPVGLVDVNIIRVLSRVFGMDISTNSTHSKAVGWSLVDSLVPVDKLAEVNWGLLDLAAIICKQTQPRCHICPLSGMCCHYSQEP
jgi:A/G-specific adenine glycosylase